jgi:hypothetical protein
MGRRHAAFAELAGDGVAAGDCGGDTDGNAGTAPALNAT